MPSITLNPAAVRERSKAISSCREIPAQGQNNIVSFMVTVEDENNTTVDPTACRVNIFCDSGTVGTSRVINGAVRQSFRRNVTSLDVVEKLLRYPEGPTLINESLIGLTDEEEEETGGGKSNKDDDDNVATRLNSPSTVQKELELATVGLAILEGEREKLDKHLHQLQLEEEQQRQEEAERLAAEKAAAASATKPQPSSPASFLDRLRLSPTSLASSSKSPTKRSVASSGSVASPPRRKASTKRNHDDASSSVSSAVSHTSHLSAESATSHHTDDAPVEMLSKFSLPTDVMKQVDQCLRDIAKMDKMVKGVATNGKGTVFLYGNGGVAYTPSIPKALYQKLRLLRSSSFASRPCLVALGTRDRYFVAFNDGTADWKGPGSLDKILKKELASANLPRSVAFGSTYDTFFIVFQDGSWQYQGRGIPQTLEEKLASRDDRADLVTVNLGPRGEWFLKSENGRMWWSGISQELDGVLAKILKEGYLHSMDFGENGSYFVTYEQE